MLQIFYENALTDSSIDGMAVNIGDKRPRLPENAIAAILRELNSTYFRQLINYFFIFHYYNLKIFT